MEKRLLLAAALSVAVLVLWEVLAPKPPAPEPPARAVPASVPLPPEPQKSAPAAAAPSPAPSPAAAIPEVSASQEERVVVDRPLYRAVFSNRGAVLVSYILKKYDDDQGQPLEMVHIEPSVSSSDLSLDFGADANATRAANTSLYRVTRSHDGREEIRFLFAGAGRSIEKTFSFGDGYLISTEVSCRGTAQPFAVNLGPGLRNLSAKEKENRFTGSSGAVYFDGERAHAVPHQKVDAIQQGTLPADGFVGLEDNYFLAVLVPEKAAGWKLEAVGDPKSKNGVEVRASAAGTHELKARLFIGPKDLDVLTALNLHLEETVSFRTMGINLGWIAKALIWLLKAAHRYVVPNWGVAILIVTFLVRLLLFPLMHKSFVGMKKMQKLQPKINAIKDRYKKAKIDAEQRNKMNQEMMALYQSEGYNPMSGCLPMVLQMPVFFAFYVILEKAIELRHAPFFFWIKDLSAKDPTYVLLILMIASMFFQQLMTPSTVDPAQRKMFLMMPLFWGFFLKDMPAGLVLYWLFSNLLGIAQQMLINRMYRDEPAPAPVRKSKNAKARG
ncbi:MAG: membrane protein insertase YidC [Thermoanaerobaculia bacterium]